jgi:hypothetical protein
VESPEQARQRLRDEATAHADDNNYRSPLATQTATSNGLSAAQQRQAYRDARKIQSGAYTDKRRFLSDPPAVYRDAGDPAALTDLGEPEKVKERQRKKEAEIAKKNGKWWNVFD